MKYLDKQAKALIICAISLCILCIVSVSYSYFSTVIESDVKPLELIMGTMKLRFDDSTNSVVLNNAFPGDKVTKKFNVKNIGNLDTTYNIKVFDVTNTFIDKEDLIYTLTKDDVEILNDISIIDNMINNVIEYNELIVNDIRNKYQGELQFLADLEQALRSFQVNESTSSSKSNTQYLLNTRHSLVRVQVKRILERKGKKC